VSTVLVMNFLGWLPEYAPIYLRSWLGKINLFIALLFTLIDLKKHFILPT